MERELTRAEGRLEAYQRRGLNPSLVQRDKATVERLRKKIDQKKDELIEVLKALLYQKRSDVNGKEKR